MLSNEGTTPTPKRKKRRQPAPSSSVNAVLGGAGVKAATHAANKKASKAERRALRVGALRASVTPTGGFTGTTAATDANLAIARARLANLKPTTLNGLNSPSLTEILHPKQVEAKREDLRQRIDWLKRSRNKQIAENRSLLTKQLHGGIAESVFGARDVAKDARKAIYGDANPNAGQIALAAAPVPSLKALQTGARVLRGVKGAEEAVNAVRGVKEASTALKTTERGAEAATKVKPHIRLKAKPAPKPTTPLRRVGQTAKTVKGAPRAAARVATRPAVRAGAKATAKLGESRGGRAALKTARVGSAPARYAIKHPVKSTAVATVAPSIPAAALGLSPAPIVASLQSGGPVLGALSDAGHAVSSVLPKGVAQNIVRDAFDLPSQAIPSIYIPLEAAIEKAGGNPEKFDALWKNFKDTDALAGLAKGDLDQVKEAIKEHPLFTALEASGAASGVGRTAGAASRSGALGRAAKEAASTERAPLKLYGDLSVNRRYSPDLIRKGAQKALENRQRRKGQDPDQATPQQVSKHLREPGRHAGLVDRSVGELEVRRRNNRSKETEAGIADRPGGKVPTETRKTMEHAASFVTQRFVRTPETWSADLQHLSQMIQRKMPGLKSKGERLAAKDNLARIHEAQLLSHDQIAQVFDAASKYAKAHGELEGQMAELGLKEHAQMQKAAAIPYARVHMGARFDHKKGLLDESGNRLTTEQIHAHMDEGGVERPGFVTHNPSGRGAGSFYRAAYPDRQSVGGKARSGEAAVRGTFDSSFDALVEQRIKTRGIIDATKGYDEILNRYGVRPPGTHFRNFNDARIAAEGLKEKTGLDWVPKRLAALRSTKAELEAIKRNGGGAEIDELSPESFEGESLMKRAYDASNNEAGEGEVVLVPQIVDKRLSEHFDGTRVQEKALQAVTGAFKTAVLPTSPKWVVGNAIDIGMRSLAAGVGPFDYLRGKKVLAELRKVDPQAADRAEAAIVGGTHFSSAKLSETHRSEDQFLNTSFQSLARVGAAIRRAPGPKQAVDFYQAYARTVFALNTKYIEHAPLIGALGREAKADFLSTTKAQHKALVLGEGAVADMANGLRNTEKQVQFARSVEQVFGRWNVNGPGARMLIQGYMPFWTWIRASSKFVTMTLPAHHPIKTGILAAAAEMSEPERKQFGLSAAADNPVPGYMNGSIPLGSGALLPTGGFTSFGTFADYPDALSSGLLPQFPITGALSGLSWTGEEIRNKDGSPLSPIQKFGLGAYSQFEATAPILSLARRSLEGGGSSSPTSTIFNPTTRDPEAKGAVSAGLAHVFNPFRTYSADDVAGARKYSKSMSITVPLGTNSTAPSSGSSSSGGWGGSSSSSSGGW